MLLRWGKECPYNGVAGNGALLPGDGQSRKWQILDELNNLAKEISRQGC